MTGVNRKSDQGETHGTPTTSGRRVRIAWLFLIVVYAATAAGWMWNYHLRGGGLLYATAALLAFLVRVLGAHVALAGVFVTVGALVLRRWRYAAACLPLLLFLLWPVRHGWVGEERTQPHGGDLTLMSVNLRYDADANHELLADIRRADPDVILFQEYANEWVPSLRNNLRSRYPHVIDFARDDPSGIALYSKLPLKTGKDHGRIQLGEWEGPNIRASLKVHGNSLVLYDVHLPMPLAPNAHKEQRLQIANLIDRVSAENYPVVIAGDFNFSETTTHHRALVDAGFRSAWEELHNGRGETWRRPGPLSFMPGLRLDHVMLSDGVDATRFERGTRRGSDHWPIIVELATT